MRLCLRLCRMRLCLRRRRTLITMSFRSALKNIFGTDSQRLPTGLLHYQHETTEEKSRIHLRLDPDGHGTLIVNANQVMHLNPTAAMMAYLLLEKKSKNEIIRTLRKNYAVSQKQVRTDFDILNDQLEQLIRPDGACPIHELDLEYRMPFSARPTAPYRMDLALTYRCNNDCPHCYNARERTFPSMSVDEWKKVIDITWELGIPHIVFTGGEPTIMNFLPELIAYAEENGQIMQIGEYVLESSCKAMQVFDGLGYKNLTVAVNLSPVQFEQEDLVEKVMTSLRRNGLDPNKLELEVTESALMTDIGSSIEKLNHLSAYGISIAIDDFGTGYSSLYYLKKFPISVLKIDRSFIMDITQEISDAQIVETIIMMAKGLGLKVVAEGVETRAQLELLKTFECEMIQGFYYSRPLPIEDVIVYFQEHNVPTNIAEQK